MVKKLKNLSPSIKFLLGMAILYIAAGIFYKNYIASVLLNLWKNIIEIIPILIIVYFFLFIINLLVKPEKIKSHLGHESGLKGWIYTVLGSVFIAGPPYVMFPILSELKKHGMSDSLIATFMNNRNVQLPFLPVMTYYFGLKFTIIVSAYILIFAILNGIIIGKLMNKIN